MLKIQIIYKINCACTQSMVNQIIFDFCGQPEAPTISHTLNRYSNLSVSETNRKSVPNWQTSSPPMRSTSTHHSQTICLFSFTTEPLRKRCQTVR